MILSLLLLAVRSDQGNPVTLRQAAAHAHMDIGTAAAPDFLGEPAYGEILGSEFSVLEPENAMKFGPIHPRPGNDPSSYDFAGADRLVAFAQAHRMRVRGHTLVWHQQQPPWVTGGMAPTKLAESLRGHIAVLLNRYQGKVFAWDVVNEAFGDNGSMRSTVWYDRPGIGFAGMGPKYIEQALRWARAADRRAKLFYNDYGAETVDAKSDAIYAMAKDFRTRRVPLDGIGFQMHTDLSFDRPSTLESFEKNLKRFAELGLDLHITELDIALHDSTEASLEAQAALYRKIADICRRQSRCKLIQTWGFTDKHSWIPNFRRGWGWALFWDENYRKKPSYQAVFESLAR